MKEIIFTITVFLLFLTGCKDTIGNIDYFPPAYNEILTVNLPESVTLKLYLLDTDSLTYGYNNVHFSVTKNSVLQTSGYIKVYPLMQMTPHLFHSTPVSDSFTYNSSSGYFSGYMIFNMQVAPPALVWRTKFTYVEGGGNSHEKDSIPLYTSYHPEKQVKLIYSYSDSANYTLTLLKPYIPLAGTNDFQIMLHRSTDEDKTFQHIRNAAMFLNVYNRDSLYQTSGNTNPVINNDGIYSGRINLPHKGLWSAADTIKYNGITITNNPPPLPEFNFEIK
jgi:hypothetical protein